VTFPCHLRESVPDSFRDRRKAPEAPETPHKTARTYPRRYTYDSVGRLLTRKNARLLTATNHYQAGFLVSTTYDDNGATPDVSYFYDALGSLKTVSDGSDTFAYAYRYNQAGPEDLRAGSATGSKQGLLPYTLTRSGTPALQTLRTYEAHRDALHKIENSAGTTTRSSYTCTVNDLGQRTGLSTAFDLGTGLTGNPGPTVWHYDDLGQLESADAPGASADRAYTYDSIGNRLLSETGAAQISDPPGTGTLAYAPDPLDQYDSITPHDQNGNQLPSFVPAYDDDGNATS
jgi:hypothetical protein